MTRAIYGLVFAAALACIPVSAQPGKIVLPPAIDGQQDGGQVRAEKAGETLIGHSGPAVVVRTIDGQEIDLSKLYGKKPVYLKFWATWCAPCRAQMPAFENEYETLGDKIQVVAVNTGFNDNMEAVKAYRDAVGIHMPIVIDDGTLASALHLRVTPQHVVIGRDGRILFVGHLDDASLHKALDSAILQSTGQASGSRIAPEAVYKLGDVPQELKLATTDGKILPLVSRKGPRKPTVLVFFSPWCESYLAKTRPQYSSDCRLVKELMSRAPRQADVRWLAISSGLWTSEEDLRDFRKSSHISIPTGLDADGRLFRAFGVQTVPTVMLLDANGKIERIADGRSNALSTNLQSIVDML